MEVCSVQVKKRKNKLQVIQLLLEGTTAYDEAIASGGAVAVASGDAVT